MGSYLVGRCGCCGAREPFGALRYTVSWQRYWVGVPPTQNEFHEAVLQCLLAKSFKLPQYLTRWQIDIYSGEAQASDPIEDFCNPLIQEVSSPLLGRPDSFIRRARNGGDGVLWQGFQIIGRGVDIQRAKIDNSTRQRMVIWRWREYWAASNTTLKEHISCRTTTDAEINLVPTLDDTTFPRIAGVAEPYGENEIIWEQVFTLAEAATLPAPFPQSCLNLLP